MSKFSRRICFPICMSILCDRLEADQKVFFPPTIPEQAVIEDGRTFRLRREKTVSLPMADGTPVLGQVPGQYDAKAIVDDALLLIDDTSKEVYAFSLNSGDYLNTIGGRGNGPGEYLNPTLVSWNPISGGIYIYDNLELRVYDRNGAFLHKEDGPQQTYRLFFDATGNSFQLMTKRIQIKSGIWSRILPSWVVAVQKADPFRKPLYTLILAEATMTNLLEYLSSMIGLTYSERFDRLYYLEPWEYKIKEIDAATGAVIRRFGVKPDRYIDLGQEVELPVKDTGRVDKGMKWASTLRDMILIDETYLLVRYRHGYAREDISKEESHVGSGFAYDLTSREKIHGFPVPYEDLEEWIRNSWTPTGTVTKDGFLYLYKSPTEEELVTSNGRIEVFSTCIE